MTYDLDLSDRTALITGGGRGIGRVIAEVFANAGADVAVMARTESEIEETVASIRSKDGESVAIPVDLTDPEELERAFTETVDSIGYPDILVNNAGVNIHASDAGHSVEDIDTMMDLNLRAVYLLSHRFSVNFQESNQTRGRIINISSVHGRQGIARRIMYSGTKAGVHGLTRGLAVTWARAGITVNSVAPGNVIFDGDLDDPHASDRDFDLDGIPVKRYCSPEDVAFVCLFLATPFADYVTGEEIMVDGGLSITTGPYTNIG